MNYEIITLSTIQIIISILTIVMEGPAPRETVYEMIYLTKSGTGTWFGVSGVAAEKLSLKLQIC